MKSILSNIVNYLSIGNAVYEGISWRIDEIIVSSWYDNIY